jgi:ankyrin repeat protein
MTTKQILLSALILGATTNIALGMKKDVSTQQNRLNKQLINDGVNINTKDYFGRTALHLNVIKGPRNATEEIIKNGIDINAQDDLRNESAMHYAARNCDLFSLKLMIKNGGNLHLKNKNGDTPRDVLQENYNHPLHHQRKECKITYSYLTHKMYMQELEK